MCKMIGGIGFEKYPRSAPLLPEAFSKLRFRKFPVAKGLIETEAAFQCRGRAGEADARRLSGDDSRVGGPATMELLNRASHAIAFDDSRSHRHCDPECMSNFVRIQTVKLGSCHARSDCPAD